MADPPKGDLFPEIHREEDAGAAFVLQSKGQWWHAGFHLTTAIVGPTILTLPYVFRGLGWPLGLLCLTVMGVVTFYSYYLMSKVLEHCEKSGRRHIRFRELAADVLGSGWMFYFVIIIQTAINTGVGIGAILLAAECLEIMYSSLSPHGSIKLYEFIALVTAVMIVLSQLPTFHSLRYINLVSLLSQPRLHFSGGRCLHSCRDFKKCSSKGLFLRIYKISKGFQCLRFNLNHCSHIWEWDPSRDTSNRGTTCHRENDNGPSLAPTWVLGLAVVFVLLQLIAIGLVYSQVAYEIMEKQSADVKQGIFSKRNLIPRLILRTIYMIFCGFVAAMLPFFGDINGVVGAIGFIPLDFILPMLLYNMTYKPQKSSVTYWINLSIMIVFTGVGILGTFSSLRKLILDANKFKLFSGDVVD
ncbi:Lysine histidine transporter 1 [Quillaja saponaria]|uniref:Lysine histidine transporter 1 n=1 Tax=Quillaja saponaria TaxID=32244 RepID=A0AAD7KS52_QUISA|nr:Lysine histidine transporter 1 [Quillaja saponaria]